MTRQRMIALSDRGLALLLAWRAASDAERRYLPRVFEDQADEVTEHWVEHGPSTAIEWVLGQIEQMEPEARERALRDLPHLITPWARLAELRRAIPSCEAPE